MSNRVNGKAKWIIPILTTIIGLAIGLSAKITLPSVVQKTESAASPLIDRSSLDIQELYEESVKKAVFIEKDEIKPLISLTKQDNNVTWNENGDKVLLLSWHKHPDSYPEGETIILKWNSIWTFTDKEIMGKYNSESDTVTDWELRMKQWIGLPPESQYTNVTGLWVDPKDVLRPAYQTDPTKNEMKISFEDNVNEEFKKWFDGNIVWSYFDSAYPWTRLGYTYDWSEGSVKKYGLTEFLINKDAEAKIAFTKTTKDFLAELAEEKLIYH